MNSPSRHWKEEQSRIISPSFIQASNTSKEVTSGFKIFTRIKFPYGKLFEDTFSAIYILNQCNNILVIPDTLYYYRRRNDSIIGKHIQEKKYNIINIFFIIFFVFSLLIILYLFLFFKFIFFIYTIQ